MERGNGGGGELLTTSGSCGILIAYMAEIYVNKKMNPVVTLVITNPNCDNPLN